MLAGTSVVAVIAVIAAVLAVKSRQQAQASRHLAEANLRAATAQKLIAQAQGMLAGTQPGGAARAFQQTLAAHALTTDEAKAIAIGESGLMRLPNSRPLFNATVLGIPRCTNWIRGVWNANRPANAGDATALPLSVLLPKDARNEPYNVQEKVPAHKDLSLTAQSLET